MYPEEQAEPAGFAPGITLRPYQRQSLAFMMNLETSTDPKITGGRQSTSDKGKGLREGHAVRGGFLVDEMVRALPIEPAAAAHAPTCGLTCFLLRQGMGKTCVCAALALATRHKGKTVVLVNNTLVGQVRAAPRSAPSSAGYLPILGLHAPPSPLALLCASGATRSRSSRPGSSFAKCTVAAR